MNIHILLFNLISVILISQTIIGQNLNNKEIYGQTLEDELEKRLTELEKEVEQERLEKEMLDKLEFEKKLNAPPQIYENSYFGIKLQYPSIWEKSDVSFESQLTCDMFLMCMVLFEILTEDKSSNKYFAIHYEDTKPENCDCNDLTEYVKWKYNMVKESPAFSFINDSKIFIGNNNTSAWQTEFFSNLNYNFNVLTIFEDRFYDFRLEIPMRKSDGTSEDFDKYVVDVKNVLKSLEFLPVVKQSNQPSFLNE